MRAKRWSALLLSGVMAASMLTGCGWNKNETVATFDETEVPLGVANFAARFLQATYDDFYVAYFGEDVWSSDLYNNGTTMQDNIKDSVMQSLFDMYTLEAHMAEYDVELTDDDKAAIADTAATGFHYRRGSIHRLHRGNGRRTWYKISQPYFKQSNGHDQTARIYL